MYVNFIYWINKYDGNNNFIWKYYITVVIINICTDNKSMLQVEDERFSSMKEIQTGRSINNGNSNSSLNGKKRRRKGEKKDWGNNTLEILTIKIYRSRSRGELNKNFR